MARYHGKGFDLEDWDEYFMDRKKDSLGYYDLPKENTQYRIIPRETLEKIQTNYCVNESELKLHLFLANMQEKGLFLGYNECPFTIKEIRDLMGLTRDTKNSKKIYLNLIWLGKLNLVQYRLEKKKNGNFNQEIYYFVLEKANYYTDGGEVEKIFSSNSEQVPENLKNSILNMEDTVNFE